jgi:hypothetical protein
LELFGLYGTSPAQKLRVSFTGLYPAIPAKGDKRYDTKKLRCLIWEFKTISKYWLM